MSGTRTTRAVSERETPDRVPHTNKNAGLMVLAGVWWCSVRMSSNNHERMYTTGLPDRLARFRMEVVVTRIMMGRSIAGRERERQRGWKRFRPGSEGVRTCSEPCLNLF
jgi:hypothetical protein